MKNKISWIILCLSIFTIATATAQKDPVEVIAVKYDKELAKQWLSVTTPANVVVTLDGSFRPAKGYQMFCIRSTKKVLVIPEHIPFKQFMKKPPTNWEITDLPGGGTASCMCDAIVGDDCSFDNSSIELKFDCTGTCNCYTWTVLGGVKTPLTFQTSGGDWFNF